MNPITRRPGPGRGRPRKLPPPPVPGDPGAPVGLTPMHMVPAHGSGPTGIPGMEHESMAHSFPSPTQAPELSQPSPHLHPLQNVQQPANVHQQPPQPDKEAVPPLDQSAPPTDQSPVPPPKDEIGAPSDPEPVQPEPEVVEDDDSGEPDPKRRRLEMSDPDTAKEVLDDEAVLALAAHNGSVDPFPSE